MDIPLDRLMLEQRHPVPPFIHWDHELGVYVGDPGFQIEADRFQMRWEGWKSAVSTLHHLITPTVDAHSQSWAGMPGHVAYSLIERHADNWTDVQRMMTEWLEANHASKM